MPPMRGPTRLRARPAPRAPRAAALAGLALCLALLTPSAHAAPGFAWPDWDSLATRHPGAPAVLLVDDEEASFDRLSNGRFGRTTDVHQVVAVLDPARAGAWIERQVLESTSRHVLAFEARTWQDAARSTPARLTTQPAAPGNPLYDEVRARRATFQRVASRTVLELHWHWESADDYYVEHRFAHDIPVERSELVLLMPRGLLAQGFEQGVRASGLSADPEISLRPGENGELRAFRWAVEDVPALAAEPLAPGAAEMSPWVRIAPQMFESLGGTWFEMGRRYHVATIAPQLKSSEPLRETATRLTAGATTPLDRVRALAGWVQREVRTAPFALGAGGYRPSPPAQVLREGMGDAKDKVVLLVELLRECGLEGRVALLRRRPLGPPDTTLLHLGQFDHAVAWIPLGSEGLWLDPSATRAPELWLPAEDQGTLAFVVGPEGGRFATTPVSPPERSVTDTRVTGTIGADGALTGTVELRVAGEAALRMRDAFAGLGDGARRELVAAAFLSRASGARVTDMTLAGADSLERPLRVSFGVNWPGFVSRDEAGERLAEVPFLPADWEGALGAASRATPIRFPGLEQHRLRLTLTPPAGARFAAAETAAAEQGERFSFQRESRREGDTLVEERVVQNEVFLVPAAELAAAREEFARLRLALSPPLRLERNP